MTDRLRHVFSRDRLADHPLWAPVVACIGDMRARPRMLAAMAGGLAALAQPPFGFLPGLFGYGLLLYALERDLGPHKRRTAFFMGWLAGFVYFLISCFWVAEAFLVDAQTYGWMAPFAATLLPAGIGLFWGTFAVVYLWLQPQGMKRFLFFASLFSVFEILRGTVLSGFPWDPAGSSWKAGGAMSQMAAYGGVYGLGFVTVTIFSSIAVIRPKDGLKGYVPILASIALLAACFCLGEARLLTTKITDTSLIVRIVQPNVGQKAKWTEGIFDQLFSDYVSMSKAPPEAGHRKPDVIIWPEGALPEVLDDLLSNESPTAPVFATLLSDKQSLLMGVTRQEVDLKRGLIWRNSLMAMRQDGDQTRIEGFYNKFKLVPFGEFTPFEGVLSRLGIKALTHFDDSFTPGARTKPVSFEGVPRFLPLICYEGIFPGLDTTHYGSEADPARPQWIVNISNDAWFGPTTGPIQHLNLASYRAIEEGLPMVRSTPTGISVLVDPLGRVIETSELTLGQRGYRDVTIPHAAHVTIYSTFGGFVAVLISFFCLILVSFDTFVSIIKKNRMQVKLFL